MGAGFLRTASVAISFSDAETAPGQGMRDHGHGTVNEAFKSFGCFLFMFKLLLLHGRYGEFHGARILIRSSSTRGYMCFPCSRRERHRVRQPLRSCAMHEQYRHTGGLETCPFGVGCSKAGPAPARLSFVGIADFWNRRHVAFMRQDVMFRG